tara:strand:+ start:1223 stop:1423 length:201 start_codon:yes stop_codon:yes gene_type:complete
MKTIIKIIGVIAGVLAGYYQVMNLFFINLNRSSNDPKNYIFDDIAQLATIIIILWFIFFCFRSIKK